MLIVDKPDSQFSIDYQGLLIRISNLDEAKQIAAPLLLQPRVLYLSYYPVLPEHAGGARLYDTFRCDYYYRNMANDAFQTVRACVPCARQREKETGKNKHLKLFPASASLEFVAMDMVGPFPTRKLATLWCCL